MTEPRYPDHVHNDYAADSLHGRATCTICNRLVAPCGAGDHGLVLDENYTFECCRACHAVDGECSNPDCPTDTPEPT